MDEETKEFINGVYPYFKILLSINENLLELIKDNTDNQPYENEELFYTLASDLIRLFPVKTKKGECDGIFLDKKSGIMLMKAHIPFIEDEYDKIMSDETCKKALKKILAIRNKYIHEPHNIAFSFSVGAKTSCSMGLYYKYDLISISTIWITNIVYELNLIFEEVKNLYIETINQCNDKYKKYPSYQYISKINLREYRKKLNRIPWAYIEIDEEYDVFSIIE